RADQRRERNDGSCLAAEEGWAAMIRAASVLFLVVAACAHDHALDRREIGAMKNASPAVSPWPGPEADPIADEQADTGTEAVINRVHGMAVQVFAAGSADGI